MLRDALRLILLLALGFLGLLFLNSTAYSLWLAGGPPTDIPQAWMHRALVHFGLAVSAMLTGWLLFVGLRPGYPWRRARLPKIWAITLLLAIGAPLLKHQLTIDRCLDSGGQWHPDRFECIR